MSDPKHIVLFKKHLPETAVSYCFGLWESLKFDFRITPERQSKYGDYRYDPRTNRHTISVNRNLNAYAFLITYIHEVAHKANFDIHQNHVSPHGTEWKLQFKKLMIPMLKEDIFPMDILKPLALHMKNPKASSVSDPNLFKALRKYDPKANSSTYLSEVEIGQKFLFKRTVYRKLEKKRTRVLCENTNSGRQYLIPGSAPVQLFKKQMA